MLELKNIKKSYKTGEFTQHALKGVSLVFDNNEFVSILGASGSVKTTLLNIIGGLDRYDSGDLIINNKSTKKFNDVLWDAYRNNCVGFIFQSYNLIGHLSVLENVMMSLTLSGVTSKNKKEPYDEVYENDAKMLLTLATDSCEDFDEFKATHLITDITEQDIKDRLSNKGFNCSVNITNNEWEAA